MAARESVYSFEWSLASPPAKLWPYVSDTQRLNEALGLPPWEFIERTSGDPFSREGRARQLGFDLQWDERPYEWIAGREMGVERLYKTGPILRLRSRVTLEPEGTGTKLRHSLTCEARGAAWEVVARIELGVRLKKRMDAVYRRIDKHVAGDSETAWKMTPPDLPPQALGRVESAKTRLILGDAIDPTLVKALADLVLKADDRTVARIRPFELDDRWGKDRARVLRLCLAAVKRGLLVMAWDILCPLCRGAKVRVEELASLQGEAHCTWCDVRIDTTTERALELVFSPSPSIRPARVRSFCAGGPGNTPHVVAQRRLAPAERARLAIDLAPGSYRLRVHGHRASTQVVAKPAGDETVPRLATIAIATAGASPDRVELLAAASELELANDDGRERLAILERTEWQDDAVTLFRVVTSRDFRELFPRQVPSPSLKLTVGTLAIAAVLVDTPEIARDLEADEVLVLRRELARRIGNIAANLGGAFAEARTDPDGRDVVLASFVEPSAAVRAAAGALEAVRAIARLRGLPPPAVRAAVDVGVAVVGARDGALSQEGKPYGSAPALAALAAPGEVIVPRTIRDDPLVAAAAGQADLAPAGSCEVPVGSERRELERLAPRARPPMNTDASTMADDVVRLEDLVLGSRLGSGGTATVRIATRQRDGRVFAVKLLEGLREGALARSERETRALERLSRIPGIVAARGHGRTDKGVFWIAMDLVEGNSLETVVRRDGPAEARRAAATCAKLARALEQAHEVGVLHRDVKPANIIIDGRGEPWLIDFGIARLAGESALTTEGMISGTLGFIAPEAFKKGYVPDERADIYGVGATFFEMVAGEPLWQTGAVAEMLARIVRDEPRALADVARDAPVEAACVAARAVAREPTARYANARALAIDLERIAAGERPIEAEVPETGSFRTTLRLAARKLGLVR